MKNIIVFILLLLCIITLYFLLFPLNPIENLSSDKIKKLELKYIDSNLYTKFCNANDISEIATYYRHKGNRSECIKWVYKCNLCRKKHIEFERVTLLNKDSFCKEL